MDFANATIKLLAAGDMLGSAVINAMEGKKKKTSKKEL